MAIQDCPHCHNTVLVANDVCPACRKNVKDMHGATPDMVRVKVWIEEQLPNLCTGCGQPTERLERVILRRGTSKAEVATKVAGGIAFAALFHKVPGFARKPSVPEVRAT